MASPAARKGEWARVKFDLIAHAHPGQDLFIIRVSATIDNLGISPAGAFLGRGIQVNLQIGLRQDNRANIAPHHDNPPAQADAALLGGQRLTHPTVG